MLSLTTPGVTIGNIARRPKHSKKQVEQVVADAERLGFTVKFPWGHWGGLVCPGDCPIIAVFSTPKNADNHAKQLRRAVDRCPHTTKEK
jgi:hypothetical protein